MSSASQQDRNKNKEDTWKSEELKRHLKLDEKRHKERRQRRNEDQEQHVESRQKYNDREKKEEQKDSRTRERYGDKDIDSIQNHQREKDKERARDREHAREKYRSGERKHSTEEIRKSRNVSNDFVSTQLEGDKAMLKRRDLRDRSDKSKQGDYDNEKRYQESRDKEERRRERGYDEDREQRHRKHREEFNIEDRERRRSERKHAERSSEDSERERRRRSEQKHMERSTEDVDEGRRKSERKHKEASSEDVDQERRRNERKHMERSLEDADRDRRRSERKHREISAQDADRERRKSEQKHIERSTEDVDEERRKRERKHKEDADRERRRERKHRGQYTEDADNVDQERRKREVKHREGSREDVDRAKLRSEQKPRERSPREERHHSRSEAQAFETRKPPLSKEKIMNERERKYREKKNREGHPDEQIHQTTEKNNYSLKEQKSEDEKESENEGSADQGFSTDAANEDSTNYEEDFEDYDDDFENDSDNETVEPERNPEIEAIQRAMFLENEKIASFPSAPKQKEREETPKQESVAVPGKEMHRGVFIDFASAKQRQVNCQLASKQKKRSTEILRLIDLDFSATLSLLDLHPVKEYEMYIRNFGRTNTKQAYVQCNEDNVDREVQTEEIDIEEKWTQHPGEGAVVSGGHKSDSTENLMTAAKIDSQRLTSFLQSACQVIAVLLEEDRAEKQSDWNVQSKEPCMSISDGCFQLNTSLPFLQARQVYHLHFSPTQRNMLLTLHGLCKDPSIARLDNSYIICVWNVWEPSTPQKVLICDAEVKCCSFSPGRATLVFAGTVDGTVAVWDLREDPTMHHTMKIADTNWTFRSATFSTDGVFTPITHTGSVRSIEPVPSAAYKDHGLSLLSSQEDVSGFSFQIASLDESAHLVLWVVVELRKVDLSGSQNDLGLIPGGKVKLVHSSSIHLDSNFFSKDVLSLGVPETLNIKFLPQDSNHFVIGTDIGIVARGTRYGLTEPPKQYKPRHGMLTPSKVTAIDFSPFGVPAFLAGCSDGCIRLHSLGAEFPIMQWSNSTGGQSVTALQWSLTRPTVFFVLDAAFCLYIWDLMQNDLQPVAKETVQLDQVLCMATLGEPEKNNGLTGLALAKASGKVEIQYIQKIWAKCQTREMEKLQLLLHEIL